MLNKFNIFLFTHTLELNIVMHKMWLDESSLNWFSIYVEIAPTQIAHTGRYNV